MFKEVKKLLILLLETITNRSISLLIVYVRLSTEPNKITVNK